MITVRIRSGVALLTTLAALAVHPASGFDRPSAQTQPASSATPTQSGALDFEFFRTRVQPIFLKKRPGHARCISCHATGTPMRLQPLSPGHAEWTEEESRRNFDAVRRMVVPGSLQSKLLIHPLSPEAGGDIFHNGGKHWTSKSDPEWQTLAAWVRGEKVSGGDR